MKGKKFDAAFKQEAVKKKLAQGNGVSGVADEKPFIIDCVVIRI